VDLQAGSDAVVAEARAGRVDEAIALADRLIETGLATVEPDSQDEHRLSILMLTRVGLRAGLQPGEEVLDECDALIRRCRELGGPASVAITIMTLGWKLAVLMPDPEDERRSDVIRRLKKTYSATAPMRSQDALARAILPSIDRLVGGGHASDALPLAREVAERLATLEGEPEQARAATAQLWIVIAIAHGGEQLTFDGETPDLAGLLALFSDKSNLELEEFTGAATELERCAELGIKGVSAADALLASFRTRDGWMLAEAITLLVKIYILQRLDLVQEAAQATNELLALDQTASVPGPGQIITALRHETDRV
jgi:hypothetical protein